MNNIDFVGCDISLINLCGLILRLNMLYSLHFYFDDNYDSETQKNAFSTIVVCYRKKNLMQTNCVPRKLMQYKRYGNT